MILNIRGTSGSGKSTVVYKLLKTHQHSQVWERDGVECLMPVTEHNLSYATELKKDGYQLLGYELMLQGKPWRIVGRYETPCGGCDGIKTQQEAEDRVKLWYNMLAQGHVLFEGLLISQIYSRWAQLGKDLGADQVLYAHLDTPLQTCLDRVNSRRQARGKEDPVNPANTTAKWNDTRRNYSKFLNDGLNAVWVDSDKLFGLLSTHPWPEAIYPQPNKSLEELLRA